MTEFKYEIKNKEVTITGVNGAPTSIEVPAEIEGYPVTSIGARAFRGCTSLISISLPNSVTSIGDSAFEKCSNLKSISISNSVTSIGSYAFAYCTNLTLIIIPNSVKEINQYAFAYCYKLEFVRLPNKLKYIGPKAFDWCPIKKVDWPTFNGFCRVDCTSGLPVHQCIDNNWRQN